MKIPFNKPPRTGREDAYVLQAMNAAKMSGDGPFGLRCQEWFEQRTGCTKALLTPSCTHALEMAAILADIGPGDEVILPSYTFVSTANAFALRGATCVFIDIRPDTLNMDENLIEAAITPSTKAIVTVHYAGVACEMDAIMAIAHRHNLIVIEDAAQGMMATYRDRPLGSIGHLAAFSFHETKNYTSGGEGGLLLINDQRFIKRAEIIREKGTNRSQFFRGMVDKYTWVDVGSSYLPSELQAAYLWAQLECADEMLQERLGIWRQYDDGLRGKGLNRVLTMPASPVHTRHNGHMYQLRCRNLDERTKVLRMLGSAGVQAVFHYVPLHTAPAAQVYGRFHGTDQHTTACSEQVIRLPMWYGLTEDAVAVVIRALEQCVGRQD